jgi:hypothetical protein
MASIGCFETSSQETTGSTNFWRVIAPKSIENTDKPSSFWRQRIVCCELPTCAQFVFELVMQILPQAFPKETVRQFHGHQINLIVWTAIAADAAGSGQNEHAQETYGCSGPSGLATH